jgi:hypothetical protein
MRRFDQIIRHAGHFGKPPPHVNNPYQKRRQSTQSEKAKLSDVGGYVSAT